MKTDTARSTAISTSEKVAYGAAGIVDLWSAYTINRLQLPIFTVALGLSPSAVSLIFLILRLWDGFCDPLVGWLSDNTRTVIGRRKPYIIVGGIMTSLAMPAMYFAEPNWGQQSIVIWVTCTGLLLYTAHSAWNVPYQSLLLEMTADTHERTSISATRAYFQGAASIVQANIWWLATLPFIAGDSGSPLPGVRVVMLAMAAVTLVLAMLPVFFVKDRVCEGSKVASKVSFRTSLKPLLKDSQFMAVAVFAALYIIGSQVAFNVSFFSRLYFVLGNDATRAAELTAIEGVIATITGLLGIPATQWFAKKWGKRATLYSSMAISIVAISTTWWTFTPDAAWLSLCSYPIVTFAAAGIWVTLPSMNGDVADHAEWKTGRRDSGIYASAFSWVVKMSYSMSVLISGPAIDAFGFDAHAGASQAPNATLGIRLCFAVLPLIFMVPGFFVLRRYRLDYKLVTEIRIQLGR